MKACPLTWHPLCRNVEKHIAEKTLEFIFCFKSSPVIFADGDAGQNSPLLCFFCSCCNEVWVIQPLVMCYVPHCQKEWRWHDDCGTWLNGVCYDHYNLLEKKKNWEKKHGWLKWRMLMCHVGRSVQQSYWLGYFGSAKALIMWAFLFFFIPLIFYFCCVVPCISHLQVLNLSRCRRIFVGKPVSDTVWFLPSSDLYPWSDGRDGRTAVPVSAAALLQSCPAMLAHRCFAVDCSFHLPGDGSAELVETELFLQSGATESLDVLLKGFPVLHPPSLQ